MHSNMAECIRMGDGMRSGIRANPRSVREPEISPVEIRSHRRNLKEGVKTTHKTVHILGGRAPDRALPAPSTRHDRRPRAAPRP